MVALDSYVIKSESPNFKGVKNSNGYKVKVLCIINLLYVIKALQT